MPSSHISAKQGLLALSPLAVFLLLYLAVSAAIGDFYKMPVSVAFLAAAVYSVAITPKGGTRARVDVFTAGASDPNILQMIWIFVLAGAFAAAATAAGCITSTVNLVLWLMPGSLLPAGLFLGACFISLSIGTSVGTIVALAPVAAGIASATGASMAFMAAIVVGGAFFGDNLSFISDTTIAATRTQGCSMIDKFRANCRIVVPAAIISLAFYVFFGFETTHTPQIAASDIKPLLILPYLVVLGCSLAGMYVGSVLTVGIASVAVAALATGGLSPMDLCTAMGDGIGSMGNLITITLLAGGMLAMIRAGGGIEYILRAMTRGISSSRAASLSIAALVSLANVCTANNTIAIITVGPLAADIARKYGVDPKRSASLLDTYSCVVQGILPYGAQLLMAAGLCGVSPLAIIPSLYYPMALFITATAAILLRKQKKSDS